MKLKGFRRTWCLLLGFSILAFKAQATHVMGGTVTYKYLGSYKYAISFILYKDNSTGVTGTLASSYNYYINPASAPYTFTSTKNTIRTAKLVGTITSVSAANAACGVTYPSVKGVYNDTITEGTDTVGYYIYTGTSARNAAISNLNLTISFGSPVQGIGLATFLPPRSTPNNSPQLVKDMTPSVCEGKTAVFNAGIYDPDGDSLVFSFVNPYDDVTRTGLGGGKPPSYPTVSFKSGYSIDYPFGTSYNPVYMDSSTGIITADIPNKTTAYILTIQVQDYRVDKLTHKAKLMSNMHVDLEFVAVNCGSRPAPKFITDTLGLKRTVNVGQPFCINVFTKDTLYSSTYDTMDITASSATLGTISTFKKPYATFVTHSATKRDSATFCWTPTCDHITYSTPHTVTFTVSDKSCNVVSETYSIYVKPRAYVSAPKLEAISVMGSQYVKLQWDTIKKDTNFSQYLILRSKNTSSGQSWSLVKTISDYKVSSWIDSTALNAKDTSYMYYMVSQNKCGDDGYNSDTFRSIIVKPSAYATGGLEFDWKSISPNYKDSFAVYADTGAGLKLIDVVKTKSYIFPYCNTNIKVQIAGRSKTTSNLSYSYEIGSYLLKDTVKPVKEPIVVGTVINWGEVDLTYTKTTSGDIDHYTIYRSTNGGAYAAIDSTYSFGTGTTITYQDKKATPATKTYCYKVVAADHCNNRQPYDPHCIINARIKSLQRGLQLSWSNYSGITIDTLKIQQYTGGKWITRKIAKSTDTMFIDSGFTCMKRTYRLLGINNSGKVTTLSDSIFGTSIDTVPPASPVWNLVSYDKATSNQIDISFKTVGNNDLVGYKLYSWVNDTLQSIPSSYTTASYPGTLSSTPTVSSNKKYCYDYVAYDSCGNISKIQKHCAIELFGKNMNLSALLNWTKYNESGLIKYYIERTTSGTWATVDSVKNTDSTYTNLNLACNVTYSFRIRASLPGNVMSYSNVVTVTPYDTIKPQVVNIESVTVLNNTSTQITFDKVSDPVVTKYAIWVRKNNGSFSLLTTLTKPTTNPVVYKHTGINTQADSFAYQVYAIDSCAGNTSPSSQTHDPVLLAGAAGDYAAGLGWTYYKGFAVKNYVVEYLSGSTWKTLATLPSNTNTYIDQPIPCVKKDYRIRVVPVSGSVSSVSDSVEVKPFDTVKPAAPVIQYATVTGFNSILVKWTKSTSNDVTVYNIYRKKGSGSLTFLKSVANVDNFTDAVNTDSGVSYCYAVQSVDSCAGNTSTMSATECVSNLKADSSTCIQKIFLSWSAYTGWTGGVSKYLVYRKAQSTGADTLIATVSGSTLSFTDSLMSNTRSYCYRVVAQQASGSATSASNYSCSKIYQIAVPQIYSASKITTSATNGTILVKWKSLKGQRFYKYYQLYYKPSTSASFTLLQNNIPIAADSFVHTGLNTQSLDHDYYLVAYDSCGNKTPVSATHQTMTITITVGQLVHNVSWTPYSGFPIKYYMIQRLIKGSFVTIDSLPATKTKDVIFPAPCNYNIFYRIAAYDSFGHYAWSDTVGKRAIDTVPSNAPTMQNATVLNAGQTQINFLGADSADTYAYGVQRATNGSWTTAATVLFTSKHAAMQYIDAINTEKDKHCYTVITLDSCLNATSSDTFCPITLTGTALNEANRLNWSKFKGYNIKNYTVYKLVGNSWTVLSTLTAKDSTLLHDSLHCGLPQYYKIMGSEAGGSGRITYSDSIMLVPFDTIIPPPSKMQYASVQPDGSVKLLWSYNTRSDVKFFEVWRKVNTNPFKKIASITFDSTYIDNGVNAKKDTISYYVITIDSCDILKHRSAPSDTDRMMHVQVMSGLCTTMNRLTWTPYSSFQSGTDSFTIYRSTAYGPFVKIKSVSSKTLTYDDANVIVGVPYTYRIQAHSVKNNFVSNSDTFPVVTRVYPSANAGSMIYASVSRTGLTNGSVHLQWNKDAASDTVARGYHLYEGDPATNVYTLIYSTNKLSDTSYNRTGINTLTAQHLYKVLVYNNCNIDGGASNIHIPVLLQATSNKNLSASVAWSKYSGAAVSSYSLYRADDNGSLHLIASLMPWDSSYTDTNIVCRHKYTYEVKTKLASGRVSESDSVIIVGKDTIAPPKSKLYVISTDTTLTTGGKIGMRFTGNSKPSRSGFNIYRSVNNGPFSFYYFLNSQKTDTVYWQDQFANTATNTYSYYIRALDSCGNEAMPADTDRSVNLKALAYSQYIQINWTAYQGFKNWKYVLEKRRLTTSWQPVTSFSSSTLAYKDSNVNCHVFYMYRIRYVDNNTGLFGFSNVDGDTAIDTTAPLISQLVRATVTQTGILNGQVQLDWNASTSKDVMGYLIYRSADGSVWNRLPNMVQALTYTDTGLNTYGTPYLYHITPIDTCGNIARSMSFNHRTIRLTATAGNQKTTLHWTSYKGWTVKEYHVYRDGSLLATVSKDSVRYIDTIATCTKTYQYTVEAVSDSLVAISTMSNIDSAKPFDHIAPDKVYVRSASVDVNAGQVVVTWDPVKAFDVKNYYIYRKTERTGDMILVDSTDKTVYYEDLSHISGADCYYVFAHDHCGNISAGSNRACLIILKGESQRGHNTLTWNGYSDWPDGVKQYNVYKNEDKGGWNSIGTSVNKGTTFDDKNLSDDVVDYCYQVEAVENDGNYNATSRSTVVCLHQDPYVFVPDAFTPVTTFGLNDSFGPKGMFIKSYTMDVFNRWGETVYHSDNSGRWDGKFHGTLAPDGVYMWVIKVESYNGQWIYYKGNVMLLY